MTDILDDHPASLELTRDHRRALFAGALADASRRHTRLQSDLIDAERGCPTGARAEAIRRAIDTARGDIGLLTRLAKDAADGAAFIAMVAAIMALWIVLDTPPAMAAAPADCAVSGAGWLGSLVLAFIGGAFVGSSILALFVMSQAAAATRENGEDYEAPLAGREG